MRTALRFLAALALLGAVLLGMPQAAWAHASLVSSTPSAGERFEALPDAATLTFSEEISAPAYVVVTAPDGSRTDAGEPVVEGQEVRAAIESTGQDGTYSLAFRVVSLDGHPVTGQLTFVVGDGPLAQSGPTPTPSGGGENAGLPAAAGSPTSPGRAGVRLWQVQAGVAIALFGAAALLYGLSRQVPR